MLTKIRCSTMFRPGLVKSVRIGHALGLLMMVLGLCGLLSSAPAAAQPAQASAAATMSGKDYELGPADVIRISVFQNPDLQIETRVGENGQITFPLIGAIRVAGLTTSQVERVMAQRLRDGNFVAQAQVNVQIVQYRSQQVSVLGMVGRPGRYPLELRDTRLTEVLALAGGALPEGSDKVYVMRGVGSKAQNFVIDLPSIYMQGRGDLDMVMQGGDSVFVYRAQQVYIYGQVQRSGNYPLERDMTVSQVIAKGGGFTLRASKTGLILKRRDANGRMTEREAKPDDPVIADDQIFVQESIF